MTESGYMAEENTVGSFWAAREPRYQLSHKGFWGENVAWEVREIARGSEITLSQKEKYPSTGMKTGSNGPNITGELS